MPHSQDIESLVDRKEFPSLGQAVYLNQAALGLISNGVVAAMRRFLEETARHGSLRMTDDEEVRFFESLREKGARLLNCSSERVAITAGASELLGSLPYMIQPRPDGEVVCVSTDFPAVTRPWIQFTGKNGGRVQFVHDTADIDPTDAIIASINERTSVVAVSSVQFATGSMIDIPRLSRATQGAGALLVVDVTQAVPAVAADAAAWQADAVVASGYKWLGGHGGVALAALSPRLLREAPPLPGWMGAPAPFDFDATALSHADDARRFTQSTMSYVSLAGLSASLDAFASLTSERLFTHARSLAVRLVTDLKGCGWSPFRPIDNRAAAPHIVALGHDQIDARFAAAELRKEGIVCGSRNGRLRVSLAPYNNGHDIRALTGTLRGIRR